MAEGAGLLPLFCWLSPSFPIGAYAYSHGLEWAAETGDIRDEGSLRAWLGSLLVHGFARNDAILLAGAFRAVAQEDAEALAEVNDLALALAPSAELRLETSQQGRSFVDVVRSAWPVAHTGLPFGPDEVALPVALGWAAASHRLALDITVRAFLTALVQNLVSAALRLAPIGQSAGQRVLASLIRDVGTVADDALRADIDDLGSATFRADLGSFRHETQYTRLFRS